MDHKPKIGTRVRINHPESVNHGLTGRVSAYGTGVNRHFVMVELDAVRSTQTQTVEQLRDIGITTDRQQVHPAFLEEHYDA